jgi:hypothetical protein
MRHLSSVAAVIAVLGVCRTAAAQQAPAAPAPDPKAGAASFTSLRIMRDKGMITQQEYDSALHDMGESTGGLAADGNTFVLGKWATTLYGFVEADNIYDTTESLNELPGNSPIARPNSEPGGGLTGGNGRFTMTARNSRIGFRIKAPAVAGIRTSAQLEMDFLGTQLPIGYGAGTGTEGANFTNGTFRIRHMNLKMETDVVDVLMGQYWQLFGWQSVYHPNTVEIQGVPGQIYSRTPQVRVSKTIKTDPVTFEIAIAATRPFQRDSAVPDGQGGLRLAFNKWTGTQTMGSTGSTISPLSIAVTGYVRQVSVPALAAAPKTTNDKVGSGIAVDAFIPVLPGTKEKKDNSLSLNGEFADGYGSNDFYTGLTGGIGWPNIPGMAPATALTPNIDPGTATYDLNGGLHFIHWQSYLFGAQYYFPGLEGKMWVSGNYSHIESNNMHFYGGYANAAAGGAGVASKTWSAEDWWDVNLFGDITPAVRLGAEYANFNTMYTDGFHAINHRVQLSGFYIF